jgi:hypothetical protein
MVPPPGKSDAELTGYNFSQPIINGPQKSTGKLLRVLLQRAAADEERSTFAATRKIPRANGKFIKNMLAILCQSGYTLLE